ncbi:MAG: DUF3368 domain-containing protein [Caldimicrobium sp.]
MPKVVCNSSVLIHLAKIDKLELLQKFYEKIFIPQAVYREVVIEGESKPEIKLIKNANWIEVVNIKDDKLVNLLNLDLDLGESESIVLGLELKADLILLDDHEARMKAKTFGLKVAGTLGVLLLAKYKGQIESLKNEIEKLKSAGFWIKEDLVKRVLREVGEE